MAKQVTRSAAKPAAKTPQRSTSGPSKAAQAAAHQGRPVPAEPKRNDPPPQRNAVATRPEAKPPVDPATVAHLPAHMQAYAGMGTENISRDDIETPRIKLMQGLSPELEEYNDLRPGMFWHPAAEMMFDEPFRAVPLFMDKRYILWRPRGDGGGIIARADDGVHWSPNRGAFEVKLDPKDGGGKVTWKLADTVAASGLANWGTMNPEDPNSPPAATLMFNYVLAFPDYPDLIPGILTFQRTAIKEGRKFNTKIKTNRAPLFGTIWEFSSFKDKNARGDEFYNMAVKGAGLVEDPDEFQRYADLHASFTSSGLQMKDIEGLQDEAVGDNVTDEGDGPRI